MGDKAFDISIHALREEGDGICFEDEFFDIQFLSTPSVRRATWTFQQTVSVSRISIHALREEGDPPAFQILPGRPVISIHALREEGDSATARQSLRWHGFLSTPSVRRATHSVC